MRKWFRILLATVTQDWREQTCKVCGETWWATANHPEVGADECAECESKSFEQWVAAQSRLKGVA